MVYFQSIIQHRPLERNAAVSHPERPLRFLELLPLDGCGQQGLTLGLQGDNPLERELVGFRRPVCGPASHNYSFYIYTHHSSTILSRCGSSNTHS